MMLLLQVREAEYLVDPETRISSNTYAQRGFIQ